MPPSGFGKKSIDGILMFVDGLYEDVVEAHERGEHPSIEAVFRHERKLLKKALQDLHINKRGKLVKRPPLYRRLGASRGRR